MSDRPRASGDIDDPAATGRDDPEAAPTVAATGREGLLEAEQAAPSPAAAEPAEPGDPHDGSRSGGPVPDEAAADDAAPEDPAAEDPAPDDAAPDEAAPEDPAPDDDTSGEDPSGEDSAGDDSSGSDSEPARPGVELPFRIATVALIFPIVFAALRDAVASWVPIGDSAYFTARSLDVGTSHTPLIGAWSSGSLEYAKPVNSLGPMEMYLLAPFTHLSPSAGTAIGVVAVQVAAVATIIGLLRRIYGARVALAGMVGIAWLVWTMGSENLVAAVQHPYLILPFAAAIVSTIGALAGERWAIVALVVFGSLCAQTHLSYPVLIAVLVPIAAVAQYRWWQRGDAPGRARSIQASIVAVTTGIVLWLPPLIDQFFGRGNLVAALTQGGGGEYPTGRRMGTQIVATVATDPATLGPRGFVHYDLNLHIAGAGQGAVLLAMLLIGAAVAIWSWTTGRSTPFYWSLVLTAVGVTMVFNASLIPGSLFGYRIDNYRWIWSWIGVCFAGAWMAIDYALTKSAAGDGPVGGASAVWKRRGPYALAAIVCGFGVWNIGQRGAPNMQAYFYATDNVSALVTQLDDYLTEHPVTGPVLIDDTHLYLGAPYNYAIAVVMQRHDIDFRFRSKLYGYRFGNDRVADGTETTALTIWVRDDALRREAQLVAYANVLEPAGLELGPVYE